MKRLTIIVGLIVAVVTFTATAYAEDKATDKRRLVEYWQFGDSKWSNGLATEVKSAINHSSDFMLTGKQKPGTLIIDVPKQVAIELVGERQRAFYIVRFWVVDDPDKDTNHMLSELEGSCWADEMKACADQIIKDARKAARKIH
jgi:hypothetical protein